MGYSEPPESMSLLDSYEDWVFDGISDAAADAFASSGKWIDGMSHLEVRNALIEIQCEMDELECLNMEADLESLTMTEMKNNNEFYTDSCLELEIFDELGMVDILDSDGMLIHYSGNTRVAPPPPVDDGVDMFDWSESLAYRD